MPPVNQCIASLILSLDVALKDHAHRPRPQCWVTDGLFTRAIDTAAPVAHIANSLSVLLLATSQVLQPEQKGKELGDTNSVTVNAFDSLLSGPGRLISNL